MLKISLYVLFLSISYSSLGAQFGEVFRNYVERQGFSMEKIDNLGMEDINTLLLSYYSVPNAEYFLRFSSTDAQFAVSPQGEKGKDGLKFIFSEKRPMEILEYFNGYYTFVNSDAGEATRYFFSKEDMELKKADLKYKIYETIKANIKNESY